MPRPMSAKEAADRLAKWEAVGISIALVDGGMAALEQDARDSRTRAPRVSGRLAATIRVVRPSSRSAAARAGQLVFRLGAGSRTRDRRKGSGVAYARVLQTGRVWTPGGEVAKTREHEIQARAGSYGGGKFRTTGVLAFARGGLNLFARKVRHPGSRFHALGYLGVNEPRLRSTVDAALQRGIDHDGLGAS